MLEFTGESSRFRHNLRRRAQNQLCTKPQTAATFSAATALVQDSERIQKCLADTGAGGPSGIPVIPLGSKVNCSGPGSHWEVLRNRLSVSGGAGRGRPGGDKAMVLEDVLRRMEQHEPALRYAGHKLPYQVGMVTLKVEVQKAVRRLGISVE